MGKGHWLRHLQVGEPRQNGLGFALRQVQQAGLQGMQLGLDGIYLVPQVEPHVRGYLIVAGPACVQLLADLTQPLSQRRLYVQMHIFQRQRPGKLACRYLLANALKASLDEPAVLAAQHAGLRQHGRMGDGALNVVRRQPLVKGDGRSECLNKSVSRFREAPAPEFLRLVRHRQKPTKKG